MNNMFFHGDMVWERLFMKGGMAWKTAHMLRKEKIGRVWKTLIFKRKFASLSKILKGFEGEVSRKHGVSGGHVVEDFVF